MSLDFTRRSERLELMDDLSLGGEDLRRTLTELAFINRTLGGYRPSVAGIAALVPRGADELTLLDVGCGGGDVTRRLVTWARANGVRAHVKAIDVSPAAVEYAREASRGYPEIVFELADVFELPREVRCDIAHASLVFHHFPDGVAERALRRLFEISRLGVVINDLHRHPLAYHSIRHLSRWLSRSRLIRNDAPLSVLRSFVREDWSRLASSAGLQPPEVRWRWAFRWQVVFRRESRAPHPEAPHPEELDERPGEPGGVRGAE